MSKRSQAWKDLERTTAKMFGGIRVKRGADFSKSAPDVEHLTYSLECKYRRSLPKLVTDGLKQASSYDGDKPPLLVLKQAGMRDAIVCMYRKDFIKCMGVKV